tara:strand:- start:166 stop:378 length:213 start_codon:yes stop_codon:yes gene_type:complete
MSEPQYEKVNHPSHYKSEEFEIIDVINSYDLNFNLGNVLKYIVRAGKKPDAERIEDLRKAKFYLEYEINK